MIFINADGQTREGNTINKGETVPNFTLRIFTGSEHPKDIRLYDIKKKLILLDIWGVNCSSCIKGFPHMLELQHKLKNDIQVILVTKNNKEQVEDLLRKLKGHVPESILGAYKELPCVLNDNIITKNFPSNGIPTHVWIDSAHLLRAITDGGTTNHENMQAFIKGEKVNFDEQGLKKIDYTYPLSWLDKDTGFLDQLEFYSLIFSRINHSGIGDRLIVAKTDSASEKIVGLSCLNTRIVDLYKLAYFKYKSPNVGIADNKVLLNVRDKSKFLWETDYTKTRNWADSSLYCFAIKVPPKNADSLYKMMQIFLDNYFNYQSKIETRRVKCLALKRISSEDKLKSGGQKPVYEISVNNKGSFLVLKNQSIDLLFSRLESLIIFQDSFIPFFNETGYLQNIDIVLPWNDNLNEISPTEVKRTLNSYGLDIVEEYKNLEMLVISDKN